MSPSRRKNRFRKGTPGRKENRCEGRRPPRDWHFGEIHVFPAGLERHMYIRKGCRVGRNQKIQGPYSDRAGKSPPEGFNTRLPPPCYLEQTCVLRFALEKISLAAVKETGTFQSQEPLG